MANALPALKPILTDKGWQKAKGLISKTDGETGIGESLKKVEALYKQINFDAIDPDKLAGGNRDQEVIDKLRIAQPKYHTSKVEPVRDALEKSAKLADVKVTEWQKKGALFKSGVKAANSVASEARDLADELKANGPFMRSFEEGNVRIEQEMGRKAQASRTLIDTGIKSLAAGLQKLKDNPSKKVWEAEVHQGCRSVCNCVRNIPALKAVYWNTWQPFGDFYHKDAPDGGDAEKDAIEAKRKTVSTALKAFNANYKTLI